MNYTVSREKNMMYFLAEDKVKPYSFDINTGVFYGLRNKPLKKNPGGFSQWVSNIWSNPTLQNDNVLKMMYRVFDYPHAFGLDWGAGVNGMGRIAEYFKLADKLNSIGYHMSTDEMYHDKMKFMSKYFKQFAKYIKDNPNGCWDDFYAKFRKQLWREQYHIIPGESLMTEDIANMMYKYAGRYPEKYTSLVAYYLTRGLYDFCQCEPQSTNFSRWDNHHEQAINLIVKYFDLCKKIGIEPEKEDFYRASVNARRTYLANQKELDMTAIANNYAKHKKAFEFHANGLVVVIPNCREDFLNEANAQRNCLYSNYTNRIIAGDTYVVFIRHEDNPTKSYITCEINSRGTIEQYLGFSNCGVSRDADNGFRAMFQNYLRENW